MGNIRLKLHILGRVQGVFFRASTKEVADKNDVKGVAKNNADGSVTVLLEGDSRGVEQVAKWCESGPDAADVTSVQAQNEEFTGEFKDFQSS